MQIPNHPNWSVPKIIRSHRSVPGPDKPRRQMGRLRPSSNTGDCHSERSEESLIWAIRFFGRFAPSDMEWVLFEALSLKGGAPGRPRRGLVYARVAPATTSEGESWIMVSRSGELVQGRIIPIELAGEPSHRKPVLNRRTKKGSNSSYCLLCSQFAAASNSPVERCGNLCHPHTCGQN